MSSTIRIMCSATLKQEPKICRFGCQHDDAFIGWLDVWLFGGWKSIIQKIFANKSSGKKDYEYKS